MRGFDLTSALVLMCSAYLVTCTTCDYTTLAQYKLTFQGLWTKARFPKVYPQSRPKAEWASLIGRSHSNSYNLFRRGELINSRLQTYVEYGDSTNLADEGQGNSLILDSFTTPAIHYGYGTTETQFFADGNRHQVSFAVKIVPSPDWFVGVDNYSLCKHGQWIDTVKFDLLPLDAGSQQGYTFSSPKWRSDPQEKIHDITSTYPNHTANAFYYPHLKELPPIAKVSISRIQEYQVKPLNNLKSMVKVPTKPTATKALNHGVMIKPPVPHFTHNNTLRVLAPRILAPSNVSPATSVRSLTPTTTASTTESTTQHEHTSSISYATHHHPETFNPISTTPVLNSKILALLDQIRSRGVSTTLLPTLTNANSEVKEKSGWFGWSATQPTPNVEHITKSSEEIVDDDEDAEYPETAGSGMLVEQINIETNHQSEIILEETAESTTEQYQSNKILPPDDDYDVQYEEKVCLVSEWTEWGSCSRTCGYGMRTKSRNVTKWTGNTACPELKMEQLCGSMKQCNWNHFSLRFNSSQSIFGNQKRIRKKKIKVPGGVTNSTGALTGHNGSFRRRYRIRTKS